MNGRVTKVGVVIAALLASSAWGQMGRRWAAEAEKKVVPNPVTGMMNSLRTAEGQALAEPLVWSTIIVDRTVRWAPGPWRHLRQPVFPRLQFCLRLRDTSPMMSLTVA